MSEEKKEVEYETKRYHYLFSLVVPLEDIKANEKVQDIMQHYDTAFMDVPIDVKHLDKGSVPVEVGVVIAAELWSNGKLLDSQVQRELESIESSFFSKTECTSYRLDCQLFDTKPEETDKMDLSKLMPKVGK